jgi:hypothetical protein
VVNQHVIAALLGDQPSVLRELSCSAPLVARGLVSVRPNGSIAVGPDVVVRLVGN